jgi:hypothetical protein
MKTHTQKIVVYQQDGVGESKIQGISKHGHGLFCLEIISIDSPLPSFIDDTQRYLACGIRADLVLDFLKHPDLSHDLAVACSRQKIPMVASGKKLQVKGVLTPPT